VSLSLLQRCQQLTLACCRPPCRQNAHHWAAAQQQRHQQQQQQQQQSSFTGSALRRSKTPGLDRAGRLNKKQGGFKRSKSFEVRGRAVTLQQHAALSLRCDTATEHTHAIPAPTTQVQRPQSRTPWSPRFVMERTLVNLLETTSSFSFKAAALLEGKAFSWQQQLQAEGSGGSGSGAAQNGGSGAAQGQHQPGLAAAQQQQSLRRQAGDNRRSKMQQQQAGGASVLDGASSAAAAATGSPVQHGSSSPRGGGPLVRLRRGPRHSRSRSLSSIQSGSSGLEEADEYHYQQPPVAWHQQQQPDEAGAAAASSSRQPPKAWSGQQHASALPPLQLPDDAPGGDDGGGNRNGSSGGGSAARVVTSPFASAAHAAVGRHSSPRSAFLESNSSGHYSGFGSAISLHTGSPASGGGRVQRGASASSGGRSSGGGSGAAAAGAAAAAVPAQPMPPLEPPFLDMVPWYSGTSADLFKTMFDLLISVKLFLGRFDMRTMQVRWTAGGGGAAVVCS
jgi:hypothetical protein